VNPKVSQEHDKKYGLSTAGDEDMGFGGPLAAFKKLARQGIVSVRSGSSFRGVWCGVPPRETVE